MLQVRASIQTIACRLGRRTRRSDVTPSAARLRTTGRDSVGYPGWLRGKLLAAIAGLALASTVAFAVRADDRAARDLVDLFQEICLRSLSDFGPAVDGFRARGFELTRAGSNRMYEIWNPQTMTGGYVAPGLGRHEERGCGVASEAVSRKPVVELVAGLLRNRRDAAFGVWNFGDPSMTAWRAEVPGGQVFVVIGPGMSERPDRGVSLHVDFQQH